MSIKDWFKPRRHPEDSNIGNVLLKMHVLEQPALTAAVEAQKETPNGQLGELLVARGAITQKQLEKALELQGKFRTGSDGELDAMLEITQHNFHSAMRRLAPREEPHHG